MKALQKIYFTQFIAKGVKNYRPFFQKRSSFDYYEIQQPMLGRWKIQYDDNIVSRKVNQANEDHSSCCVYEFDDDEDYMLPYCM
jgi:hypothetical protein